MKPNKKSKRRWRERRGDAGDIDRAYRRMLKKHPAMERYIKVQFPSFTDAVINSFGGAGKRGPIVEDFECLE